MRGILRALHASTGAGYVVQAGRHAVEFNHKEKFKRVTAHKGGCSDLLKLHFASCILAFPTLDFKEIRANLYFIYILRSIWTKKSDFRSQSNT